VRRIRREAVKGIGVSRASKPSKKHAGAEEICGEGMDFTATSKHRTRTSSRFLLFFFLPSPSREKKLSRTGAEKTNDHSQRASCQIAKSPRESLQPGGSEIRIRGNCSFPLECCNFFCLRLYS